MGGLVLADFEVGEHNVTLLVDDGSDTGTASSTFEVIAGSAAVEELILRVNESILQQNRKQSLITTLNAACASLEGGSFVSGLGQLKMFQTKVRVQGSRQNPELADRLIQVTQEIINNLDEPQ